MKKLLLSMVCLIMAGTQNVNAAIYAQIALQHNGNVTHFERDQLDDAIKAAEAGDTIFLSEGSYGSSSENIHISKAITIIGAGAAHTAITTKQVYISIPDSTILTARFLDGVLISGSLYVNCAVTGLTFRKCEISGTLGSSYSTLNSIKKMVIDRCSIGILTLHESIRSLTAYNSKICFYGSGYTSESAMFVNCNVSFYNSEWYGAHFLNCLIANKNSNYSNYTRFTNCLAAEGFSGFTPSMATNCYTYSGDLTDTSNEYFVNQGWVGTDGTAVGMYGSSTPFSLEPSGLSVSSYTLGVDTKAKKLNVTMTLDFH